MAPCKSTSRRRSAARSRRRAVHPAPRAPELVSTFAFALAVAAACASAPEPAPPPSPAPASPTRVTTPSPPPPCERIVEIVVFKAERQLLASCARGGERRLHLALGREPAGPKREAGDHRTPEGRYHVREEAPESRFHRFVPIDYPSPADAEAAWREGRLSDEDRRRILRAHAEGRMPPADTPLGGDIGFHGEGERWRGDSRDLDWTYGCMALPDADIDFLAERAPPGTPVRILPGEAPPGGG